MDAQCCRGLEDKLDTSLPLYLGIDISTQAAKCCVIDKHLHFVYQDSVSYEADLPHYQTTAGAIFSDNQDGVVEASPLMWAEAVQNLCSRLHAKQLSGRIATISCAAQQHGSVFWKQGAMASLSSKTEEAPTICSPDVTSFLSLS